MLEDTLNIDTL